MTALSTGRNILATRVYKLNIEETYGVNAGGIDLWNEYNRYMMIKVLEWDATAGYLTDSQRRCLESKIQRPNKPCNC